MKLPEYPFVRQAGRLLNAGQSRSLVLTGNIYDLFFAEAESLEGDDSGEGAYVPLVEYLADKWQVNDVILVVYELNGPVRFVRAGDEEKVKDAWLKWRTGMDADQLAIKRMLSTKKAAALTEVHGRDFDTNARTATGNPTFALEWLRQLCLCSRSSLGERPLLKENLLILVEAADLILPEGEIPSLSDVDRHRVAVCQDWFSDPGFTNGGDSVVMVAESRSLLNHRITHLPHVLEVPIPSPDMDQRRHFISWFNCSLPEDKRLSLWGSQHDLAEATAGLSLHALSQLLRGAAHGRTRLAHETVLDKVEQYIQGQLGDDIVEFKKPVHRLKDVVGFAQLKAFLQSELIPRFAASGEDALPGAAVCGAIGSGKTFIFEAMAAELDMVVLVLKNIRSQWFGQTDVVFERLRRVLEALSKVMIFVDEADTQFGGVGPETHATERRLTGKIQAMMSDPKLRGRVTWLLMTARIQHLSPDIRRPGRVGDLIIPVLDPEGDDRLAFLRWMAAGALGRTPTEEEVAQLDQAMEDTAAATFAALRSELKARARREDGGLTMERVIEVIDDHIAPAIADTRRYQTLQALMNCTRKSLLPFDKITPEMRAGWLREARALEARGVT